MNAQLRDNPAWKKIAAAWSQAQDIAAGKKGDYPFNQKEKDDLLKALKDAGEDAESLCRKGLMTKQEAKLMQGELDYLQYEVGKKRPTEMMNATCYKPMSTSMIAGESVERLEKRVPLLASLIKEGTITSEVAEKVVSTVEIDIGELENEYMLNSLQEKERARAQKIIGKLKTQIAKIRARLRKK
jgi:hypothetical protein